MVGVLRGDSVLLEQKEGSQFYNRGNYGYPVKRNFELDLIEACYLVESGRLKVERDGKELSFEEIPGLPPALLKVATTLPDLSLIV